LLLSLGLVTTVAVYTYMMAGLSVFAINYDAKIFHPHAPCPEGLATCVPMDIFINGCIFLGFKYIDILRFVFIFIQACRAPVETEIVQTQINPAFQRE
jgi:hypothetical protein